MVTADYQTGFLAVGGALQKAERIIDPLLPLTGSPHDPLMYSFMSSATSTGIEKTGVASDASVISAFGFYMLERLPSKLTFIICIAMSAISESNKIRQHMISFSLPLGANCFTHYEASDA
jgi:hypothetical protein